LITKQQVITKQEKDNNWQNKRATYAWHGDIDYRAHPEKYQVGKGEQGVLLCEPYKSEILPHWHFRTIEVAKESSDKIYCLFENYLRQNEFVGADMSRKYLQMGYTRARRYANHAGGRKYAPQTGLEMPCTPEEPVKAEAARIFYARWKEAEAHPIYQSMKAQWKKELG
jgi:hypothetical protein